MIYPTGNKVKLSKEDVEKIANGSHERYELVDTEVFRFYTTEVTISLIFSDKHSDHIRWCRYELKGEPHYVAQTAGETQIIPTQWSKNDLPE